MRKRPPPRIRSRCKRPVRGRHRASSARDECRDTSPLTPRGDPVVSNRWRTGTNVRVSIAVNEVGIPAGKIARPLRRLATPVNAIARRPRAVARGVAEIARRISTSRETRCHDRDLFRRSRETFSGSRDTFAASRHPLGVTTVTAECLRAKTAEPCRSRSSLNDVVQPAQ